MEDYSKLYYLMKKYHKYDDIIMQKNRFLYGLKYPKEDVYSCPILIDALFTGHTLPTANHSFDKINKQILEDIREIIRILPSSVNCRIATMRCREYVPAFVLACINENIPWNIVKEIAKINPSIDYYFNSTKVTFNHDLNNDYLKITSARQDKIILLLKELELYNPQEI